MSSAWPALPADGVPDHDAVQLGDEYDRIAGDRGAELGPFLLPGHVPPIGRAEFALEGVPQLVQNVPIVFSRWADGHGGQ